MNKAKKTTKPKNIKQAKRPKRKTEKQELFIDQFYASRDTADQRAGFRSPKPQTAQSVGFAWRLLMISSLSFFSGIVAILLVVSGTWQVPGFSVENLLDFSQVNVARPESVTVIASDRARQVVERNYESVLGIYPANLIQSETSRISASAALLQAIVLTSDGWLATVNPDGLNLKSVLISDSLQNFYEITEAVDDPASEILFVKIDAQNLKPIQVASQNLVGPLEELVILKGGLTIQDVQAIKTAVLQTIEFDNEQTSAQQSSESFSRAIAIEKDLSDNYLGSLVLNLAGEAVGIIQPGQSALTVFPLKNLDRAIFSLLRQGVVKRVFLGVRYLDLSFTAGLKPTETQGQKKGALLYNHAVFDPAIIPGSPAAAAGLQPRDIILRVEGETVNGRAGLTELIQDYRPGDKVILTVWRGGDIIDLEVELGTWPVENKN
jgi:S1-C subfamily serine protease